MKQIRQKMGQALINGGTIQQKCEKMFKTLQLAGKQNSNGGSWVPTSQPFIHFWPVRLNCIILQIVVQTAVVFLENILIGLIRTITSYVLLTILPIHSCDMKQLSLDLGLRRVYKWLFVNASVSHTIIGVDFLEWYGLLVDNQSLIVNQSSLFLVGNVRNGVYLNLTLFQEIVRTINFWINYPVPHIHDFASNWRGKTVSFKDRSRKSLSPMS